MDLDALLKLGLNKKEAQTYVALLELGSTTTGSIIKKTKIPSSKIYQILDSLISKGLVSYIITANKKYFEAADPSKFDSLLREKEERLKQFEKELKTTIDELLKRQELSKKISRAKIFEGFKGIKTLEERIMSLVEKGDIVYFIGTPKIENPSLAAYFRGLHRRRIKKGVLYKIIKNYDTGVEKFVDDLPLTEVRYMPQGFKTPTLFKVFKNIVAIIMYSPIAIAFVMENEYIAKSFRTYFDMLWQLNSKVN